MEQDRQVQLAERSSLHKRKNHSRNSNSSSLS
jgi:hypothetical protein